MVIAIFVIAYPVETWFVKPKDTALRSATKYFLIGLAMTLVSLVLIFTSIAKVYTAWSWWPIYLFFGSIIGTYSACVGRLIYPRLLKVLTGKAEAVTETI